MKRTEIKNEERNMNELEKELNKKITEREMEKAIRRVKVK